MRIIGVMLALGLAAGCSGDLDVASPATAPAVADPVAPEATASDQEAVLERVVDGDTIDVLLKPRDALARVRLLAVDTPERGECGFKQAGAFVRAQLPPGHAMVLVRDPGEPDKDFRARLLRYVRYAPPSSDLMADLSLAVVEAGWAEHADKYPTSASPAIRAAEARARAARVGQWAPESVGGCAA